MIPGVKRANDYRDAYMELATWNFQKDCYLSHFNNGEIEMDSVRNIIMVEKSEVSIFTAGGHRATVMASEDRFDIFFFF